MRECFVIMPIGSGKAYEVYRNRYKLIIEPAVEGLQIDGQQAFRCVRADFVTKTGSITRDVLSRLYRADAVLADLTDLNPNVFYELGVRHALRSGTVLIGLKGTKPPFDVGDLRLIPYEDRLGGETVAIPQIQEVLMSLISEPHQQDSPVLDAIPDLVKDRVLKDQTAQIAALEHERELLNAQLRVSEKANLASQNSLGALSQAIEKLTKGLSEPVRKSVEIELDSLVEKKPTRPVDLKPRSGDVAVESGTIFVLMPFTRDLEPVYTS